MRSCEARRDLSRVALDATSQARAYRSFSSDFDGSSVPNEREHDPDFFFQLIFSVFKTLTDQQVTVELKNDLSITGVLKSVDQCVESTTSFQRHEQVSAQILEHPTGQHQGP